MWSTIAIEMQVQQIAAERLAEVRAARLSDTARRVAVCEETERRIARSAPMPTSAGPIVPAGL